MNNKEKAFWKDKKVLITGHEGFLGSWIAKVLVSHGAIIAGMDKVKNRRISMLNSIRKNITCIRGDVADLKLVRDTIERFKPQFIFHLAAEAIVVHAHKNPIEAFKSNIEGTWNILEAARNRKFIRAIITASSDKAYGESKKLPYKEGTPLCGDHPYDVSKACADLLAYTYFHSYGLPVCITRCGNVYGPGDFNFSRIIPDTIRSALQNRTLLIRSDGAFTRDYVYVEDIVNGYILLAEELQRLKLQGEAFNFSNESPLSVKDLVKKIYHSADKKPMYKILKKAKYEIKHQYLSSGKARKILGWKPAYSIDEGLQKTIDWYRKVFYRDD